MMRNSPYSDIELLEIATGFKKHLKDSFATIQSVCPVLDQNFVFRFKALYYEVHSQYSDRDSDGIVQTFRLELEALADQVKSLIPLFRFYLQKAFPYDSTKWQAFGYCEVEKVVHDFASMRDFLMTSVRLIHEKKWELKAANCPDSAMEELVLLSKRVSDTHDELEEFLQKKAGRKDAYNTNLNELYKLMKVVHEAVSKCHEIDYQIFKSLTFPQKEQV